MLYNDAKIHLINSMGNYSYLTSLGCSACGESYNLQQAQTVCSRCNSPLLVSYDLKALANYVDRHELSLRPKGIWRWHELLPVYDRRNIISLGEGDTPLLPLNTIGQELGLHSLYLKEEGQNPTGSFKARGISTAVSKAMELGIHKIVIPSAGNAGGALAAYAARAGIKALIYMPKASPKANIAECGIAGAEVKLVDGLISEAGIFAQEAADSLGWFNISTFKEPYRLEGKKTLGYEIAERLQWKLPDVIIYPTGGGTGLVGMWKAFRELELLGWVEPGRKPKMIAVQAEGCAPVVKAFQSGQEECDVWIDAHTIATGLCVPHSYADRLILKYIRESHGTAISVSDREIMESRVQLAQKEGVVACPEGAATLAGLKKILSQGSLSADETVVLFNTATGLKYIDILS